MSRIEAGTYASQIMQTPVSVAKQGKPADSRPVADRTVPQSGSTTDASTIRMNKEFAQLQRINEQQNRAATQIRNDDQQLQQPDQVLGQMKRVLSDIIKYYPPYPAGEPERVKFLRSFSSMRKQIEQMTIPPESTWKGKMPGEMPPQTAAIQVGDGSNASAAAVPGVATTFNIPDLADAADNGQIEATLNQIDAAQAMIADRRATLAEQAPSVNHSEGYGAKVNELKQASTEAWDLVVPAEHEAEQKSINTGSELEKSAIGMTSTDMQPLLQSLGG